ncbi:nucleotidyltransferase family protein [Longimicrobium terrae]|uniref:Putative nucleotidyltransferase n=1 Tax=Longimicrobium terrae TaxID=1639882 RepID=A0A841GU46_9BACT|nr:nucleotidyltransferase domain-containing protein [Longimicrobium terrae]MBB4634697.1 putative nucleotidyltransferase [Longimicrobium terrae]MBB6068413.1 putative nucleotidyltransferase [Longimicrobium terrae]NNC32693.1 nucleotidyltransferase domain-containing protein [Longimicrobium terrae]
MDQLSELLGSEARARLLAHFVVRPESRMHARALGRHLGLAGKRSLQTEVDRLVDLGLLERATDATRVLITRNAAHPQWTALASLVREYGSALVLRDALADVPGLRAAFVFGSYARRDARPDSDIDLLLFGDEVPERELGRALLDAALVLDRPVDAKRYDTSTFLQDATEKDGFLPSALRGPKLWLAGSPAEFPVLA